MALVGAFVALVRAFVALVGAFVAFTPVPQLLSLLSLEKNHRISSKKHFVVKGLYLNTLLISI